MSVIWVDSRTGSKELQSALQRHGLRAELTTLDAGDFAFEGNGPDGPLQIGIERKTLSDLTTCLRDGRLCGLPTEEGRGGQLHRLLDTYDVVWLLVEGHWATDAGGRLFTRAGHSKQKLPGSFTEDSLTKQLLTLELKGQIRIQHTAGATQSAAWLASLLRWWTDKKWSQHQTLDVTHTRHRSLTPLSTFREMTLPLPGVGLAGSKALERYFDGSMGRLLAADMQTLADIPIQTPTGPRRLGEKAHALRTALNKLL